MFQFSCIFTPLVLWRAIRVFSISAGSKDFVPLSYKHMLPFGTIRAKSSSGKRNGCKELILCKKKMPIWIGFHQPCFFLSQACFRFHIVTVWPWKVKEKQCVLFKFRFWDHSAALRGRRAAWIFGCRGATTHFGWSFRKISGLKVLFSERTYVLYPDRPWFLFLKLHRGDSNHKM